MRSLTSNYCRALNALLILAISAVVLPARPSHAQVDTLTIDVPTPPTPPTRKRIVIGGSGVRIEDEDADTDTDTDTSGVDFDFDFKYEGEDHSDDIVKVGESVMVKAGDVVAGDVVVFGGNAIIEGTVV